MTSKDVGFPQAVRCRICYSPLSKYTKGTLCSPCEKADSDATVLGEMNGLLGRAARGLAWVYANPEHFETAEKYTQELSSRLDGLCAFARFSPPDLSQQRQRKDGWFPVTGGDGSCGEVRSVAPRELQVAS